MGLTNLWCHVWTAFLASVTYPCLYWAEPVALLCSDARALYYNSRCGTLLAFVLFGWFWYEAG